ncbi:MAG: single-stranded-DNA-specific exonuclease RecJ [Lentisphaerae bacterium]|nr:single-stranded-DNA-specific exonuclease RecJ [Lentisphaerota bacterium]
MRLPYCVWRSRRFPCIITGMLPLYDWTTPADDPAAAAALADAFDIPVAAARVLAARGWADPVAAERFLNPRLADLSDPLALPGMAEAVTRLWRAVDAGESVVVFGDFDADGVAATAILTSALNAFGCRVTPFIPDRLSEGYGLSSAALVRLAAQHPDARLVVTVDCGITSAAAVRALSADGREVIVTDHHVPDATNPLPCGGVVINPHLPGTPAGCEALCGAGIAFKLACALWKTGKAAGRPGTEAWDPRAWFDAVAVATVADVVPLRGENRLLVRHGLKRLHEKPSTGLHALLRKALATAEAPTSHHLGFLLGPRINAAGRMRDAWPAFELLCTRDTDQARELAATLDQLNSERRHAEESIIAEALAQLAALPAPRAPGAIVAGGADWHPGAVGIVAARLSERAGVPAAVVCLRPDGGGRGSLRAGKDYDALAALRQCQDLLDGFGGHRLAAGFEIKPGCFDTFRAAFVTACAAQRPESSGRQTLVLDGWLDPNELTIDLWQALARMEPFGEGNARPRWAMRHVALAERRAIGADGTHVMFRFDCGGRPFRGVWFKAGHLLDAIPATGDQCFDVAFECQLNRYRGTESVEMLIVDLRPSV